MDIWKNEKVLENVDLYQAIDDFFEKTKSSKTLEYREGQHTMALDVLDAMLNKDILLIESGVGIGKSYAYLVPLLLTYKEDKKFQSFIISTSTIALQEQLRGVIEDLSKMLEVDIPVTVAKGKTNYVCLKKIKKLCEMAEDEKEKEIYQNLLDRALNGDVDRVSLEDIGEDVWKKVHITNCNFQNCLEYYRCPFVLERDKFSQTGAIICNHDLLIQNLKKDEDEKLFSHPSAIVLDEAHQLEDKIRNSYVRFLDKRHIENIVFRIYERIFEGDSSIVESEFFEILNKTFAYIRNFTKYKISESNQEEIELDLNTKVGFEVTDKLRQSIEQLIRFFQRLLKMYEAYERELSSVVTSHEIEEIKRAMHLFRDMLLKEKSQNIYWASFMGEYSQYVRIYYAPKNLELQASKLLADPSYGKILTSATLTTGPDDYSYFSKNIGLDKIVGINVLKEYPQSSPYNYQDHSLIYYDKSVASPEKRDEYLNDIYLKVVELFKMTNGKSLVLFTSKNDMNYVYDRLMEVGFDFPIYKQEEGNEYLVKRKFEEEVNSCLLATGAFWEGIDIKGNSLSSLIIARLPFPIVDPIIDAKASLYSDGFGQVYLKEMLLQLKQGIGRAIRTEDDVALISILDSRMERYNSNYDNIIFDNFKAYPITSDQNKVTQFVKKHPSFK